MKILKNFDNGRLSVTVTKIDTVEDIIHERPLEPHEDFSTFHTPMIPDNKPPVDPNNYTVNTNGFTLNIKKSYR